MQKHSRKDIEPILRHLYEGLPGSANLVPVEITGVAYDSRLVAPGNAFVCITGEQVDGNQFIDDAVQNGASCIFSQLPAKECSVPYFQVRDVRLALALLANYFYDHPAGKLRPLGVTGTNGKTTTTHLVEHILNVSGRKTGLIGTLGARWPEQPAYQNIKHTTPQASDLQKTLAAMVDASCSHVSMEVSSHALAQLRTAGCDFAVACLTNITQDHLDYHQTMEQYWMAKRKLFEGLNESCHTGKTAIANADDNLANEFLSVVRPPIARLTYGWNPGSDLFVKKADFRFSATELALSTPWGECNLSLKMTGRFNVYNTMAALLICLAEGATLSQCKEALEQFGGVCGRFEVVSSGSGTEPLVIVDYAHTPDGLENVLKTARGLVPEGGKLVGVFGCGGDRDSSKRPQMGQIAESLCDEVVVTSDNPRSEDPQQIIADILAGIKRMKGTVVEPDRATAIRTAVKQADNRDVVLVAGKGHENYQILADRTIPFDDRTEVKLALQERAAERS